MCLACDFAAGLGSFARTNKLQVNSASDGSSGIGRRRFVGGALACVGVVAEAIATVNPAKPAESVGGDRKADTVFQNGAVYTVAPARPWAEAIAIGDGRILAVGSIDDVRSFIGAKTEVIDLQGQMLLPGFVEGHAHPLLGAFMAAGVDLQYPTRAEALTALRQYAALNPTGALRGFGRRLP
jgi:Amidohydrolase family